MGIYALPKEGLPRVQTDGSIKESEGVGVENNIANKEHKMTIYKIKNCKIRNIIENFSQIIR